MTARPLFALGVLFALNALNFFDRNILFAVAEPVRRELGLGDAALGVLGTAFTLVYAAAGVPLGRLADAGIRTRILAAGVLAWSLLTAASGLATSFAALVALRLGVGIGEATCAPAATSLVGDLFPAARRARALSVFMLGLPAGLALSYAISGAVAEAWGWRAAFYVAGLPGLACAGAILLVPEPPRGAADPAAAQATAPRPLRRVLAIPTLRWIIASGAIHNFTLYALSTFLTPYLMRVHGTGLREAGFVSMLVYGVAGGVGLVLGGLAGDAAFARRRDGRMRIGAWAVAGAVPLLAVALVQPAGAVSAFGICLGTAVALLYFYYATVYATIQDVVPPRLRGTAMAVYFFAMYVLGASFGPVATGLLSDRFAARAARTAGVLATTAEALEPFRAAGLRAAMVFLPLFGIALAAVLFAASRTVARDMGELSLPPPTAS